MDDIISVIIPCYKVEKFLPKCLDSIVGQTYKNLQIIIVDDGSPDACGQIIDEYAAIDSRIEVIHKKNEGLCAARNDGLRLARGKWVAFVDSDDWCELNMYEEVMKIAKRDDSDIIIFDLFRNIGTNQKRVKAFNQEFVTEDRNIIKQLQESALHISFAPYGGKWRQGFPWDKVFKRELIEENNLRYPIGIKADEDVIFCIQAFHFSKKVSYASIPLYHYRLNNNSIGYKFTPDRERIDKDVFAKQFEIGKEYGLSKEYFDAVNSRIIHMTIRLGWRSYFNPQYPGTLYSKIKKMNKALHSEPIYSAFDKVEKKRLRLDERVALISRHHNVWVIYFISKFAFVYIGLKSRQ